VAISAIFGRAMPELPKNLIGSGISASAIFPRGRCVQVQVASRAAEPYVESSGVASRRFNNDGLRYAVSCMKGHEVVIIERASLNIGC
jgi:hypothetical protein